MGSGVLGRTRHRSRSGVDLGVRRRRRSPGRRGGRGALAELRHPGHAHRTARPRRQLLGAGWAYRPVRPVLRALLRPGPRVRLRWRHMCARLRLRPLHGVLEPRLRPVRDGRHGGAHAAAPAKHRHGHGARAPGHHHPGRSRRLRDRSLRLTDGYGIASDRRADGRLRSWSSCPAGHDRACQSGGLPRHGRRPSGQRGPRLRTAARHSSGRPAGRLHRHRQAIPGRPGRAGRG